MPGAHSASAPITWLVGHGRPPPQTMSGSRESLLRVNSGVGPGAQG